MRYLRRGAVLPAPNPLRITSWAGTHVTSHRMQQRPFMWVGSAPGATALLIRQNKGNFLHVWLPPTFLARGKKKKKRWRQRCEPTPLILPILCSLHGRRRAQIYLTFLTSRTSGAHTRAPHGSASPRGTGSQDLRRILWLRPYQAKPSPSPTLWQGG